MRSANPTLPDDLYYGSRVYGGERMTVQGVIFKTLISLLLVMLTAGYTWLKFSETGNPAAVTPWMIGGAIVGFVLSLATVFKKEWALITAPLYALAEGLFIGGISAIFEQSYSGIVFQAACLTFGTLFAMLMAYQSGLIRVTETFKMIIVAATGGIALVYLIGIVLSFFGIGMQFIFGSGPFGILFSVFVVGVAAFNLVMDFDFIEKGSAMGAPKYMEWYGSFALMVTLIWLYIEFLRLLSKLRDNR